MDQSAKRNKLLTRLRRLLLMLVISLVVGTSAYSLSARHLAGNAVPTPFGIGLSVVLSGSMEPSLSVGDLLLVRATEDFAVGDVVVYQSGSMAVVHRLIELNEDTALTKGDANNAADAPIPLTALRGRVAASLPLAGYLVMAIQTPVGALAILALALWLLDRSYRREKEQDAAKTAALREEIRLLRQQIEEENKE